MLMTAPVSKVAIQRRVNRAAPVELVIKHNPCWRGYG